MLNLHTKGVVLHLFELVTDILQKMFQETLKLTLSVGNAEPTAGYPQNPVLVRPPPVYPNLYGQSNVDVTCGNELVCARVEEGS